MSLFKHTRPRPLPLPDTPPALDPKLLPAYAAVVECVHRHRFMTAYQVQASLPEMIETERTARAWMKRLRDCRYLAVVPVRNTSHSFYHVHYVTPEGMKFVRQHYEILGLEFSGSVEDIRPTGKSFEFSLHEILLTEIQIKIAKEVERLGLKLRFAERRYRQNKLQFRDRGKLRTLIPDAGFLIGVPPNKSNWLFLVEFDNGTEPIATLTRKIEGYQAWVGSEEGKTYLEEFYRGQGWKNPQPVIRLLMILHHGVASPEESEGRRLRLILDRAKLNDQFQSMLLLVEATPFNKAPLDAPIWVRPHDQTKRHPLVQA
jgi:hypothetical protein